MKIYLLGPLLALFFFTTVCCASDPKPGQANAPVVLDTLPPIKKPIIESPAEEESPTATDYIPKSGPATGTIRSGRPAPASPSSLPADFADVAVQEPGIKIDIRYANANNFTKKQIYDCPRCLLRPIVADALAKAHRSLKTKGYGLKVFDCYRPRPYQQRLWDAVPDANYVTPPTKGSMHSRGAAVDLTIVDSNGKELDMGTPYDFFGREAHTDYLNLPQNTLANRKLLRETMEAAGFKGIRTEWWHFSFRGNTFPLSDYTWECE